ncbi:MAG: hypothetical protein ACI9R3_002620 [Verrucomicrobiales bacterium]|jgi:hypothetical protein
MKMRSSEIAITGWGAVSATGWGVPPLFNAMQSGEIPEPEVRQRDGATHPVRVRAVPIAPVGTMPRHPRLRRASPQVKFAAAACMEALGDARIARVQEGNLRLGVVFATMCGAVQYSNRFYEEVLKNPATASPILFPETVFNAPSSHLSAIFRSTAANYTLVGDSAEFLAALRVARDWLSTGEVEGCLVVGVEELDWVSWEAMQLFDRLGTASEGAGALYLELEKGDRDGIILKDVTEPSIWLNLQEKQESAMFARQQLSSKISPEALLAASATGHAVTDAAERITWADWQGPQLATGLSLGNCMGAGVALNAVLACEHIAQGKVAEAVVSAAGHHHQCLAAWFGAA